MPTNVDPEILKQAVKEAIHEWLDSRYATLGRWTMNGLCALAFAGMVYLALRGQGWTKS